MALIKINNVTFSEADIRKIIVLEQFTDTFNIMVSCDDIHWRLYRRAPFSETTLKIIQNQLYDQNSDIQTKKVQSLKMVVPVEWLTPKTTMEI